MEEQQRERIEDWCSEICERHGVNYWFFAEYLVRLKPETEEDAERFMSWLMFKAFHFNYDDMYRSFQIGQTVQLNGKDYQITGIHAKSFLLERGGKVYEARR